MAIRKKGICPKCKQEKLLVQRGLCWNCYIADAEERMPGFLERRNKQKREHYKNNKEEILKKSCEKAKNNRDKINKRKREWRHSKPNENDFKRWRYHNDLNYKLYHSFGGNVSELIQGRRKSFIEFEKVTGYSFETLKQHLESKFKPEMKWQNYGEFWNIDHILSRRKFNYQSWYDSEFKKFWALSNIQPLFVKENMRKQEFTKVPK